jgi:hypothetical protein
MVRTGLVAGLVVLAGLGAASTANAVSFVGVCSDGGTACQGVPLSDELGAVGAVNGVLQTACLSGSPVHAPPVHLCSDYIGGGCLASLNYVKVDGVAALRGKWAGCSSSTHELVIDTP